MGRKRLYDEALRTQLLDRAGEAISRRGVEGLSLRGLAASARTSTAAVYALFGGKPGLLAALYEEAFRRFAANLSCVTPSEDPVEDTINLGLAYRRSAIADPNYYWVMFGNAIAPDDMTEELRHIAAQTFTPLLDAVQRAVTSGSFKPANPAAIATALWANVHGLVSLELGNYLPPQAGDPREVFEAAVRAAAAGWSTGTAPQPTELQS